jgi:hypothetical protein
MRYRLRTLLIVLAVGPPMMALGWLVFDDIRNRASQTAVWEEELSLIHGTGQTVESDDDPSAWPD